MRSASKALTAIAVALAALGTWGAWWWGSEARPTKSEKSLTTASSAPEPSRRQGKRTHASATTTGSERTAATGVLSLSEKVNSLSSSRDPRDAFTAYHILTQCEAAKEEERQYQQTRQAERDPDRALLVQSGVVGPKAVENACGDLRPGDFRDRLALVEHAAEAGIPMAALRFAGEGPWGDEQALYTRWDDPLVKEWRARAIRLIQLAASKGDVTALNSLQAQYEDGAGLIGEKNPELALRYAVAKHIVYEAQTGKSILGAKRELQDMAAAISPDVAARARSDGEALAREIIGGNK